MSTGSLQVFLSSTWANVTKAFVRNGHWPRRFVMSKKSFFGSGRARFARATASLFALVAIGALFVACGGGGGGGGGGGVTPPPPPPDPVDAVITLGATVPASGAVDVKVGDPLTVAWTVGKGTYDSASATLACDGSAVAGSLSANKSGGTFTPAADLPKGATCASQGTAKALGENGGKSATVSWNITFQTEKPVVVTLDPYDVAIGVRYGMVGVITKTAPFWKDADNQTSYQTGALPLSNCVVAEEPLANGYFLEVCWAAADSKPHIVQHNPITNVVTDFVGVAPAGYELAYSGSGTKWNFGPKWHASPWGTAPYAYTASWAGEPSGGYFWTDFADGRILRYQSATGVQSVLYTSPDGGAFAVMVRVKH